MSSTPKTAATLFGVLALYRRLLGRKLYLLAVLMPLASISEGFGIALLLPLLGALDRGQVRGEDGKSLAGEALAWLPLPESPLSLLALIAAAFFLKAALKLTTESLRGYFQAKLMLRIKTRLIRGYTDLDFSAFGKQNTGHYVNVINGQTNRFSLVFQNIGQVLTNAVTAVIFLSIAALANWQFALIALVAGLLFMLTMKALTNWVRDLSRKTAIELSHLNKQLVQVLHSLKYLMATHRTTNLVDRVRGSCRRLFRYEIRTKLVSAFTVSVREPLSVVLVLALVAVQIRFLNQPLAAILVPLLLLYRTTQALFNITGIWQKAMQMIGSAEMIQSEFHFVENHQEPRSSHELERFHRGVEFQDVSFAYDTLDGKVLRSVDISIPRNRTIALVGRSGAGKSTLADLLTLLLRPSGGRILIDGHDVSDIDPRSWRRQLGYVCQETVVFDETIAANICLNETAYRDDADCRRRVHAAAEQAFVHSFIESMPDGYDTIVGDRGVRLSGGQRQRLFIARELYKQPRLLILDEATSALDGASEKAIQDSIDALRGQITVVVIAHRLATIKNADYIYVLDGGEVIEHGPYERLYGKTESRFRHMVDLQAL